MKKYNHNKRLKRTSTASRVLCFLATLARNNQLRSGGLAGRYGYMKINIVIISTFMILVAGCEKEAQELTISIHREEVFINSEKVVDLEGELKSLSCSEDTKIKLQATQGLPYDQLKMVMSQISKAGCMNQLEFERL
ncbi:ExbD/TolR family protein [Aurantivibrio infirmus]